MDDPTKLINTFMTGGVVSVLLLIIVLIVHKPERAEKIKEIFFLPLFRLLRFGSHQYIASKVAYATSTFLSQNLRNLIPSIPSIDLRIKWVRSAKDPVFQENGSIVLFMEEVDDQSRNILAATQVALPKIVCPTLRPFVIPDISDAIDLALLKRLAEGLGKHAVPVFQKYFLSPALAESAQLPKLFKELVELDHDGVFVPVFLDEISLLGETISLSGDASDHSADILGLLQYLLTEARRAEGEFIRLDHVTKDIKVSIILLAISMKMERRGVTPYVNRINQVLAKGVDSIYVISYEPAFGFLDKLLSVLDGDNRLTLIKNITVYATKTGGSSKRKIALLRRSPMFSDNSFERLIAANEVSVGSSVEGQVLDVSQDCAFVDVKGINAVVYRSEVSWETTNSCSEILEPGRRYQFLVKQVDLNKSIIQLSLRHSINDPWASKNLPSIGDNVEVVVFAYNAISYRARYLDGIEIMIPKSEVSWTDPPDPSDSQLLRTNQRIKVIDRSDANRSIIGSIRQLNPDPWPAIHKKHPPGTELHGVVVEVEPQFVRVQLQNGLLGIVPKESFFKAGFEYQSFESNVVKGQGLELVVTKVFLNKRRIRLDLKRNVATANKRK